MSSPDMTPQWEGYLNEARRFKEEGNTFYTQKSFKDAMRCYHRCILNAKALTNIPLQNGGIGGMLIGDTDQGTSGSKGDSASRGHPFAEEARKLLGAVYSNLAACIIQNLNSKQDDYRRCIEYCNKSLEYEKGNAKSMYRKGVALYKMEEYYKAMDSLHEAETLGTNAEIRQYLDLCQQALAEKDKKSRAELKGMFDRHRAAQAMPHGQPHAGVAGGVANGLPTAPGQAVPSHMCNGNVLPADNGTDENDFIES